MKKLKIVLVSFIGNTDIDHIDKRLEGTDLPSDASPLLRLMKMAADDLGVEAFRAVLIGDRKDENLKREKAFIEALKAHNDLAAHKTRFDVDYKHLDKIANPTEHGPLFHGAMEALKKFVAQENQFHFRKKKVEYWFHLTSGTPTMHAVTLLLASRLPFESSGRTPLLWQVQRGRPPIRHELPGELALRLTEEPGEETFRSVQLKCPPSDHFVSDRRVLLVYKAMERAALGSVVPNPILLWGPRGCGKATAARWLSQCRAKAVLEYEAKEVASLDRAAWRPTLAVSAPPAESRSPSGKRSASSATPPAPNVVLLHVDKLDEAQGRRLLQQLRGANAELIVLTATALTRPSWWPEVFGSWKLPAVGVRTDLVHIASAMIGRTAAATTQLNDVKVAIAKTPLTDGLWSLKQWIEGAAAVTESGGSLTASALADGAHQPRVDNASRVIAWCCQQLATASDLSARGLTVSTLLHALEYATLELHTARLKAGERTATDSRLGYTTAASKQVRSGNRAYGQAYEKIRAHLACQHDAPR